ncbi:unnamed protein product [Hyaloperonospora brassicae]|uniref:Uncharacterized protein n=1 Tax=Hyaloperonospora brassicae TaxID=162125 RepID=A0AAV0UHB5_HYABA|nr:unnamed protein product [Hyaloperonospora brassicae]
MALTVAQAFEVFSERDRNRENLSILTCTEEEEVLDYFDAGWDEQDVDGLSLSPVESVDAMWSSFVSSDSSSVLGGCTSSAPSSNNLLSRQRSCPLLISTGEARSLPKVNSMPPLYRPSDLGIDLVSITGDPRGVKSRS